MQINKDIFVKQEDKIKIDFTGNSVPWLKELVNKMFNFDPPKPKKEKVDKAK